MACGERYRHLIKNAIGGTVDRPCNVYCNAGDAQSWKQAALTLADRVGLQWETLVRAEVSPPSDLQINLTDYEAASKAFPDVPKFAWPETWTQQVSLFVAHMEQGVCLLERIDDALTAAGKTPPPVPGVSPPKDAAAFDFSGPLWLLAIGGALFLAFKIGVFRDE